MLTADQEDLYRDNGFLVIEGVFAHADCDRVVRIYEKYAKSDYRGVMNLDRGFIEYRELVDGRETVERVEIDPQDATCIRAMMTHPTIVADIEQLQRSEISVLQSMFLFKRAGSPYALQAWNPHQDNAYPQAAYGMYITMGIALEDQDATNGGVYFYPGSHREGDLPHEPVKSFHERPGENPGHRASVPSQYKPMDMRLDKGAVWYLHGHLVHGSYANRSTSRSRAMLLMSYITKGASFVAGRVAARTALPVR